MGMIYQPFPVSLFYINDFLKIFIIKHLLIFDKKPLINQS